MALDAKATEKKTCVSIHVYFQKALMIMIAEVKPIH